MTNSNKITSIYDVAQLITYSTVTSNNDNLIKEVISKNQSYIMSSPTLVNYLQQAINSGDFYLNIDANNNDITIYNSSTPHMIDLSSSMNSASSAVLVGLSNTTTISNPMTILVGLLSHEISHFSDYQNNVMKGNVYSDKYVVTQVLSEAKALYTQIKVASEMDKVNGTENLDLTPYINVNPIDNEKIKSLWQQYNSNSDHISYTQLIVDFANMFSDGYTITNVKGQQVPYPIYYSGGKYNYLNFTLDKNGDINVSFTDTTKKTFTPSLQSILGDDLLNHIITKTQSDGDNTSGTNTTPAPLVTTGSENTINGKTPLMQKISYILSCLGVVRDPIIIDYDKNGINIMPESNSSPYYDYSQNGVSQQTSWIGQGTYFLVTLDKNGQPVLLGDNTTSGFTMLSQYDINKDGVINSLDTGYSQLYLWNGQDIGHVKSSDLQTLQQAKITSISLNTVSVNNEYDGATVVKTSTVTMEDGSTTDADDTYLATSSINTTTNIDQDISNGTISTTVTVNGQSIDLTTLPNLHGCGTLSSLLGTMVAGS